MPLALSTVDGFLLPGLVSVEGVGQKNGCATTDQKRNNERHEQYSCSDDTFLTPFGFQDRFIGLREWFRRRDHFVASDIRSVERVGRRVHAKPAARPAAMLNWHRNWRPTQ